MPGSTIGSGSVGGAIDTGIFHDAGTTSGTLGAADAGTLGEVPEVGLTWFDVGTLGEGITIAPLAADLGTLAESPAVAGTPHAADPATLAEGVALALAAGDPATLAEAAGPIALGQAEPGRLADSGAIAATGVAGDAGTLADAAAVRGLPGGADPGTLAELAYVAVAIVAADAGTVGEAAGVAASVGARDSAGSFDTAPQAPSGLGVAGLDAATLADSQAAVLGGVVLVSAGDTAGLDDSQAGAGGAGPGGGTTVADVDTATLGETAAIAAVLADIDAGALLDLRSVARAIFFADHAGLDDSGGLTVGVAASDSGGLGDGPGVGTPGAGVPAADDLGVLVETACVALVGVPPDGGIYLVYANDGLGGPIEYATPIATTGDLSIALGPLSYPGDWSFGVRAAWNPPLLEERNVDCRTRIVLDAAGVDVTRRPNAPAGLTAVAGPAGSILARWAYSPAGQGGPPTGFHLYLSAGPTLDYAAPAATVPYSPARPSFAATLAGLIDGTSYVLGVRAFNATAEEPNATAVAATAVATGPAAPPSLTIAPGDAG